MNLYRNVSLQNLVLATDSYKLNHWNQYPSDTEAVYSYMESRAGAKWPYTVFFGLQSILKRYLTGIRVRPSDLDEANDLALEHFGRSGMWNATGWRHIVNDHGGMLPLRIKAVPEGTPVPTGNVLMTVENTCSRCFWLTNAVESLLTHVWYPSTVATLSRTTKQQLHYHLEQTGSDLAGLPFMLHDFGYRGASSHETAAIGGAGHLVNFVGTDTLPAMQLAMLDYGASLESLAFSVPATEHSVMTALGREGELQVVDRLLDEYPAGILSVVADSYDIYNFVTAIGENQSDRFRDRIMARAGVFVVRPDSVTATHPEPEQLVCWIAESLWDDFGGTRTATGHRLLDSHVRILWGDGIDQTGILKILARLNAKGFAAGNIVFGMGGGLLQKVNRDTQRFAFKASAIKRGGEWHDVCKEPLDLSKRSKAGRLALMRTTAADGAEEYRTVRQDELALAYDDELRVVFEDGELMNEMTFDQVRENAWLEMPVLA